MSIKEIHAKAGSLSNYWVYIVILFVWYFLNNVYTTMQAGSAGSGLETLLSMGLSLLIFPVVLAGVFGGIHERQSTQDVFGENGFFKGIKSNTLRFVAANLLTYFVFAVITIVVMMIVTMMAGGSEPAGLEGNQWLPAVIAVPWSAINIFWFSAMTVERKIFRGLWHGVKTLLSNPMALGIGILWGAVGFADTAVFDLRSEAIPLAINGLRSGVLAICRILAMTYALAFYKSLWGEPIEALPGELSPEAERTKSGDGLANTSFGFALFAFIPLVHLAALVLGILALKRKQQFGVRPAIACGVGGFFTVFYLILAAALLLGKPAVASAPGYQFLAEANPDLEPYVVRLEMGEGMGLLQQLDTNFTNPAARGWEIDCTAGLAKYQEGDLEGALADFSNALQKNPESGEFYYYYGLALLEKGQAETAGEQFKKALTYEPGLAGAQRYARLVETAFKPSAASSALLMVMILLLSFTVHEYGHAFAAWKLGDDTAKNLGRLTLNPVPHLDLIGSILLPAVLLWQQVGVVFGWAKPVPVNPANFKDPNRDHMRVSFAGPATNIIVAMVSILTLGLILLGVRLLWPGTISLNLAEPYSAVSLEGPPFALWIVFVIVILKQIFFTSVVLGCFNLIPVPPLDGSWIFAGILPPRLREVLEQGRRFSSIVFLLLVLTPVLDYFLAIPFGIAWGLLNVFASAMGFA